MALNLPERICENCHQSYKPKKTYQRFCKEKCRNAFHNKPTIKCPLCGGTFKKGAMKVPENRS